MQKLPPPEAAVPVVPAVSMASAIKEKKKKRKTKKATNPIQPPKAQAVIVATPTTKGFKAAVVATKVLDPTPVPRPPKVDRPVVDVLSTNSASTWRRPVAEPVPEVAAIVLADQVVDTNISEVRIEKDRVLALEQIEAEKAQQAATVKAQQDAQARQAADDLARDDA